LLDLCVYSSFFKDDEVAPITAIDLVSGVVARLDGGITANNAAIINFIDDYKGEHGKAGDSIGSMWLCLEVLPISRLGESLLDSRPIMQFYI
jgi:hypothetical protein